VRELGLRSIVVENLLLILGPSRCGDDRLIQFTDQAEPPRLMRTRRVTQSMSLYGGTSGMPRTCPTKNSCQSATDHLAGRRNKESRQRRMRSHSPAARAVTGLDQL